MKKALFLFFFRVHKNIASHITVTGLLEKTDTFFGNNCRANAFREHFQKDQVSPNGRKLIQEKL